MSDTSTHASPAAAQDALFSASEVEQFAADDVTAGGAIGKMLSALFLYTVLAMGISGWWTWAAVSSESSETPAAESGEHADHHDHGHKTSGH